MAGRLLEEDADKAQDNVDDEEACLVSPDALGQGQGLHQSPADLHTDHPAVISRRTTMQQDCKQTYNGTELGKHCGSQWQCTMKAYLKVACLCIALPFWLHLQAGLCLIGILRERGVLTHQGPKHEAKDRDGDRAQDVGATADIRRALLALVEQLVDGETDGCAHWQGRVC